MEKELKLKYNPNITLEVISDILRRRYPEYEQSWQRISIQGPFLRLKKSMFVHACIFVKQKPQKGITMIGINGHMSTLAIICFGFIFHYVLRGSFLTDVLNSIDEELSSNSSTY